MNKVRLRKLIWYGYIKLSSLPVKTAVEGVFPGKRRRGRPQSRCRDDNQEWTNNELIMTNNEQGSFTPLLFSINY